MSILSELANMLDAVVRAWEVVLKISSGRKNKELKTITWTDIQSATKFFGRKLQYQEFKPDFIITPGQKGGIVAQLIKDFYKEDIPILSGFLIKGKKAVENDLTLSTTKWDVHMPILLKEFEPKEQIKLLIVDDFVMSGDFIHLLKENLLELGYLEKNIYSCAIAVTKVAIDAHKGPNYYWKVVDDKDFCFPWGKAE